MRIKRISNDQFTIFLSFEDMIERGIKKDDLWQNVSRVQEFFSDMMYEASLELDLELEGSLLVHVQLMQAQGMQVIVTQQLVLQEQVRTENNDLIIDDFIEIKVTLDESEELIYAFLDFEDVIQVISHLKNLGIQGGQVYYMDDKYYMLLDKVDFKNRSYENLIALMSEYSQPSIVTPYRLIEYGKVIYSSDAINQIAQVFLNEK